MLSPSALAGVAGITALVGALKGFVDFGKKTMEITSHFEQTQKSLETVLQDADKGKKLFEDLRKFSFDTTFGVDELASASSQLLNVGMKTKDLNKNLKMLGDLAQGDKQKFAELTSIFAKVQATGKVSSMQLQQLALRGIPIIQTFKDMNVTGERTAEDLSKAFETLTGESGQFHDAMNNIIDTIEGKQGFISDTIKEIAVNFGEASGMTDMYKMSLDGLYKVVEFVNNALAKINENPLLKGIFSGVLTSAIVGLATVIGVTLFSSLKLVGTQLTSLIAEMGILKTLSGPTGWITLAVSAFAGLTVGIAGAVKKQKELNEEMKKLSNDFSFEGTTTKYENKIKQLDKEIAQLRANPYDDNGVLVGEEQIKLLEQEKKRQTEIYNLLKLQNDLYEQRKATVESMNQNYKDVITDINAQFENTSGGKLEKQLEELKKLQGYQNAQTAQLVAINNGQGGTVVQTKGLEESEKTKLFKLISQIEKDIKEQELKIKIDEVKGGMSDYQKYLQNLMGISDEEFIKKYSKEISGVMVANIGSTDAVNSVTKGIEKELAKYKVFGTGETLNMTESAIYEEYLSKQEQMLQALVSRAGIATEDTNYSKTGELTINSEAVKKLNEEIEKTRKALESVKIKEQIDALSKENGIFEKLLNNSKSLKDYQEEYNRLKAKANDEEYKQLKALKEKNAYLQALASAYSLSALVEALKMAGSDHKGLGSVLGGVNDVVSGSEIGDILDSVIEGKEGWDIVLDMFIKGISKVIGGLDGMSTILNPIYEMLKQFEPLIKTVLLVFLVLEKTLVKLTSWIMELLNKLTGGAFDNFASIWDDLVSAQEESSKSLKEINEEYKSLLSSMKEQEEYYLSMKKSINSDTYKNSVYSVNDMILTPEGTFSTSPQDTIMAMKHPEDLMGKSTVNVQINNTMGDSANVQATQQSDGTLLVTISKKIASDVARGVNGWDSAFDVRNQRLNGRG